MRKGRDEVEGGGEKKKKKRKKRRVAVGGRTWRKCSVQLPLSPKKIQSRRE